MENIKSYLDGELDIAQKAEVETHLHNDAELQKMVEEFSAISTTLKTADGGEPYGLDKLEARLAAEPSAARTTILERKKIWRTAINWSAGSACVVILAAIMFPVFAQSKMAAKKTSILSASRMSDGDATASSAKAKVAPDVLITGAGRSGDEPNSSTIAPQGVKTGTPGGGGPEDPPTVGAVEMQERIKAGGKLNGSSGDAATTDGVSPEGGDSNAKQDYQTGTPNTGIGGAGGNTEVINGHGGVAAGSGRASGSSNISTAREAEHRSTRGNDSAPNSQWYDKKTPQPESAIKQEMRAKRDNVTQPIPGVPETDHGIYLERKGDMQVKVEDLKRAVNEATGMIAGLDGFVTASNTQNQQDGGEATMTLRVPTKNFTSAIDKLEAMGELIAENTGSQDITNETVNNGARMISWADEEKRLMDELAKAKTDNQRYRLKQLIGNARANLEAHKAQVNSLLERAKYSTIQLSLVRGDKATAIKGGSSGNWSGNALRGAKDNLSDIGQVLGTVAIYFLVFCPIWLPFAIAGIMIYRKNKS